MQDDTPCIWVLLPSGEVLYETHTIDTYGTGHPMPNNPGRYIGTYQTGEGLVFHVFDELG